MIQERRDGSTGPAPDAPAAGPLDVDAASTFLREQADGLAQGLRQADDPLAVRAVLRSHDASHRLWLQLIAAVSPFDPAAGDALAALYALHGRVAGSLERGGAGLLDAELERQVRRLLAERLRGCTEDAILALRRAARRAEATA